MWVTLAALAAGSLFSGVLWVIWWLGGDVWGAGSAARGSDAL